MVACTYSEMTLPEHLPSGAIIIKQDELSFSPRSVTVRAGEVLYFWNGESAIHNLVFGSQDRSPDMKASDVFERRFLEPGEYEVTCDYHPQMRLQVSVVE